MLPEPTTTLTLPDGRLLACDDVGDRDGPAVVYLHGAPDCRLARPGDLVPGVRLVALDRPGYGWSDPPAPDPLAFGEDVGRLLDHLGVDGCSVAAWSAGAPWAFGAAAALGGRVERVVTYGAVAPLEAFADAAVRKASAARAGVVDAVVDGDATADEVADEAAMLLVPSPPVPVELARDQVLESLDPALGLFADTLALSLAAAVDRHADAGLRCDLLVQLRPGIESLLAYVRCPVVLVHGDRDPVSGPAVGRWLAERLTDAAVGTWTDAGHQEVLARWSAWLHLATGR